MYKTLEELIQNPIFANFYRISQVPRPSFKEEGIAIALENWAKEKGLEVVRDEWNNVLIKKQASPGKEKLEPVILQAHTDMVCQKAPGQHHDFDRDSIHLEYKDDILSTGGRTTLGADDGIGVALAMTLLEDESFSHPPLRAIFTTAEEEDMRGAKGISSDWIDSTKLINLDNSRENILVSGSAGGQGVKLTLPIQREFLDSSEYVIAEIRVEGFCGGHSGGDIHRGRGNAIRVLSLILHKLYRDQNIRVLSVEGGSFRLAIPREAEACIAVPKAKINETNMLFEQISDLIQKRYQDVEKNMALRMAPVDNKEDFSALSKKSQESLLQVLLLSPIGINDMYGDLGVPESSMNLGELYEKDEEICLGYEIRATFQLSQDYLYECLRILAEENGGKAENFANYPSWLYTSQSTLRTVALEANKKIGIENLQAVVVHGGLEVAFFKSKAENLDAVSIGPNTWDLHSPEERVSISSTLRIYNLLKEMLQSLA